MAAVAEACPELLARLPLVSFATAAVLSPLNM